MAAMRAAAMGCSTWAKGDGCVKVVLNAGGGALMAVHKGQSKVRFATSSSPCTTSFIAPALEHTMSTPLGFTKGDAMATPTDNANHTSTKRVSCMALRKRFMCRILSTRCGALFHTSIDTHQPHLV